MEVSKLLLLKNKELVLVKLLNPSITETLELEAISKVPPTVVKLFKAVKLLIFPSRAHELPMVCRAFNPLKLNVELLL